MYYMILQCCMECGGCMNKKGGIMDKDEIRRRFECYDQHIIALGKNVQSHEFWLYLLSFVFIIILIIAFFWIRHEFRDVFRDVQEQIPQGEWECVNNGNLSCYLDYNDRWIYGDERIICNCSKSQYVRYE